MQVGKKFAVHLPSVLLRSRFSITQSPIYCATILRKLLLLLSQTFRNLSRGMRHLRFFLSRQKQIWDKVHRQIHHRPQDKSPDHIQNGMLLYKNCRQANKCREYNGANAHHFIMFQGRTTIDSDADPNGIKTVYARTAVYRPVIRVNKGSQVNQDIFPPKFL